LNYYHPSIVLSIFAYRRFTELQNSLNLSIILEKISILNLIKRKLGEKPLFMPPPFKLAKIGH